MLGKLDPSARFPFDRHSAIRRVTSEPIMFATVQRALVMDVAHAKVGQGVADHSGFRRQPMTRLWSTTDAGVRLVFGDSEMAREAARHVYRIHDHINGSTADGAAYTAHDASLLLWVWATLVDSFDTGFTRWVRPFRPGESGPPLLPAGLDESGPILLREGGVGLRLRDEGGDDATVGALPQSSRPGQQHGPEVAAERTRVGQPRFDVGPGAVDGFERQGLFRWPPAVDRRLAHAGSLGDGVHARAGQAVIEQELTRRVEDRQAGLLAAGAAAARRGGPRLRHRPSARSASASWTLVTSRRS